MMYVNSVKVLFLLIHPFDPFFSFNLDQIYGVLPNTIQNDYFPFYLEIPFLCRKIR